MDLRVESLIGINLKIKTNNKMRLNSCLQKCNMILLDHPV